MRQALPRVREIIAATASIYGVSTEAIKGTDARKPICQARFAAYYVAARLCKYPVLHVAIYCGGRDPSGVGEALERIDTGAYRHAHSIKKLSAEILHIAMSYAQRRIKRDYVHDIYAQTRTVADRVKAPVVMTKTQFELFQLDKIVSTSGTKEPGDPSNRSWWDRGNQKFAQAMKDLEEAA